MRIALATWFACDEKEARLSQDVHLQEIRMMAKISASSQLLKREEPVSHNSFIDRLVV